MTPLLAQPVATPAAQLRRAYRQLVALPARTRWAVGFAAPLAAVGACLATAALLPATAYRPTPVAGLLAWLLAASVVTDLLWRRVFNFVLGPALVCVGLLHAAGAAGVPTGLPSASASLTGLAVCFGLMLVLYLTFRGGEGDVKLVAVLGAALGWWHGVEATVFAYLLAAAVAALVVAARFAHRACAASRRPAPLFAGTLPMAPFFAAGVLFTLT